MRKTTPRVLRFVRSIPLSLSHHTIVIPPTVLPEGRYCDQVDTATSALLPVAWPGWKSMFLAMITQAMRAILLASATATSLKGFFASKLRAQFASCVSMAKRANGFGIKPRKRYARTTDSNHDSPIYPNLYGNVIPARPDMVWVADFTYVRIAVGF